MRSRYDVLLPIASGGMATVHLGRLRGASGFSRLVAIKRPHGFTSEESELKRQLAEEAQVAALIHHPNVVSVLDVEEIEGELFLVMDYVEGCSLKDLLDGAHVKGAAMDAIAVRVILDVAAGLHAAHRLQDPDGKLLGVVHRDVSPHNVLVGLDGVARLADFGIAKIANAERERTTNNVLKGKVAYLAPEYLEGRTFSARSDLYSLGVVTWEALAGQRLFKGASAQETLRRVLAGPAPHLATVRPELAAIGDVVAAALARQPEDRPESVEAFARALEECARRSDAVATHGEVGALVEEVAGERLAERRRRLEGRESQPIAASLDPGAASERDQMVTESLLAPAPTLAAPRAAPGRTRVWLGGVVLAGLVVAILASTRAAPSGSNARSPEPVTSSSESSEPVATAPTASESIPIAPRDERPPTEASGDGTAEPPSSAIPAARRPPRHRPSRALPSASAVRLPTHAPPNPYERPEN